MAGITGRGTTYTLPNYHGVLFNITPEDTPLLSMIGGLTGGKPVRATEWEWQYFDLRAPAQVTRLEGADAPAAEERVRANASNVVEIHQETVDVSYTKLAATQAYASATSGADNPVLDEADWQITQMLKQIARDIEFSFIRGAYQKPVDNTTPRKTRGLLEATATNVIAKAAAPSLTKKDVIDLMQLIWENGGIQESETATIIVNAVQKRWITKLFVTDANYQEQTRDVGGVSVQTIETDFGRLNVMLNRYMPADVVGIASVEDLFPALLEIPEKGFLFVEPLAKTGASDKSQVYGEIGLEYGNERKHGKITGLGVTAPAS